MPSAIAGSQRIDLSKASDAIARGKSLYRAGSHAEAAAIFSGMLAQSPDNASALRLLGMCRLRLGDPTAALALLERAYALAPTDAYAQLHLGFALHAVGRYEEAAVLFRACQPLLPGDAAPSLNLSACLYALGELVQAQAAARRARLRAPRLAEARYMLGLTAMALGQLSTAGIEFDIALRLDPRLVKAWVSLGMLRYRREDMEGAKRATRRALAIAPGHPTATANMFVFLRLSGYGYEAEALLDAARARDPDAVELRLSAAVELLQDGNAAEALSLLEGAPPAEPFARQHWQAQRASALIGCNRAEEAQQLLDEIGTPLPQLLAIVLWRRVLLALGADDLAAARDLAEAVEAALTDAVVPEYRIILHYHLAQFWIHHGERARGFSFWVGGHRLLARYQPFSRAVRRGFTDAAIASFDHVRLHREPRARNQDQAPVFIVGMPRSGTTLAEQIIGAHARGFAAGERPALGQVWRHLGGQFDTAESVRNVAALNANALDEASTKYLSALHALAPDAERIVDKMPGNVSYLGLVALMLPGARIIHCTRDPRDVGLSIFTHRFFGHHPYAHDLADLGWTIGETERLMAHWRTVLPNPILSLPMRDWVDDFDATLRRVLAFLALPYDAACERFYEQETRVRTASRWQVRQPVNARGLDRWRAFATELQPMIAELVASGMIDDSEDESV